MDADLTILPDILRARACDNPDDIAFQWVETGSSPETLSWSQLYEQASGIAAWLQNNPAAGQHVLVSCVQGLDVLRGIFGCFLAGAVAVPISPKIARNGLETLEGICKTTKPGHLIADQDALSSLCRLPGAIDLLPEQKMIPGTASYGCPFKDVVVTRDATAFVQFTSGSTGSPRGVEVTHRQLAHNLDQSRIAYGLSRDSIGVSWLPPFHDMGLVGGLLAPVFSGFTANIFSPARFAADPLAWLRLLSTTRATISGGPCFAYDLCCRSATDADIRSLDLSALEVAFCGAEPVFAQVLERFAERFAPAGFRLEAFRPSYGLAEATLFVSASVAGTAPRIHDFQREALVNGLVVPAAPETGVSTTRLVSHGRPAEGVDISILQPGELAMVQSGQTGEICLSSPSVAKGYIGEPEQTAATFVNDKHIGKGNFLRTGDLGFLHEGELFITGRLKDLIIVAGRKFQPHDIEQCAAHADPGLGLQRSIAFSLPMGDTTRERVVLIQEMRRGSDSEALTRLADRIRHTVLAGHGLVLDCVVFTKSGSLPRTTSGKPRRRACAESFARGALDRVSLHRVDFDRTGQKDNIVHGDRQTHEFSAMSHTDRRADVQQFLEAELAGAGLSKPGRNQPMSALGMDSLSALSLRNGLFKRFGADLPISTILTSTEPDLVEIVSDRTSGKNDHSATTLDIVKGATTVTQAGLWHANALSPESTHLTLAYVLEIETTLSPETILSACKTLLSRHPVLRARFTLNAEGFLQWYPTGISDDAISYQNATGWRDDRLAEAERMAAFRPFDLSVGSPCRFDLFKTGPEHVNLVVSAHHIVADHTSLATMNEELAQLMSGVREEELPAPADICTFAASEAAFLSGSGGVRHKAYWSERLRHMAPRTRPALTSTGQSGAGARTFNISPRITERLRKLAREQGVTLHTVLLACFQICIPRLLGSAEFTFGAITSTRASDVEDQIIGPLVNMLPVDAMLKDNPTFTKHLARVWEQTLEALNHRTYPFPLMQYTQQGSSSSFETLQPGIVFNMLKETRIGTGQTADQAALHPPSPGSETTGMRARKLDRPDSQFDLMLTCIEAPSCLFLALEFDRSVYDDATTDAMAQSLLRLLSLAPDKLDARVADILPAHPVNMDHPSPTTKNVIQHAPTTSDPLLDLLEAGLQIEPHSAAVAGEDTSLTHKELHSRSNRIAHHLRKLGVVPETPVIVSLGRNTQMIVALLAIAKSGGIAVPLDPDFPEARKALVLQKTKSDVLITEKSLAAKNANSAVKRVLLIDGMDLSDLPDHPPAVVTCKDHIAYILFTSGSTGIPKGVMVTRGGLANTLRDLASRTGISRHDRLLAVTTFSFDMSQVEVFLPLIVGARVKLARACDLRDGARLLEELADTTVLQATPSTWALLGAAGLEKAPDLVAITGGEPLGAELAKTMLGSGATVLNCYGPTETAIYATADHVMSADSITIGRPVLNSSAWILDAALHPVQPGTAGELFIGGEGLARGYLDAPALTAANFVPDPFGSPGSRLYRTGDRVLQRADGRIEYLGRSDRQLKIRGHRIEPGEVEAALLTCPGVTNAVVMPRQMNRDDLRLAAFLTLEENGTPDRDTGYIRRYLRRELPRYMIPSDVNILGEMPRLPNGKVDRNALEGMKIVSPTHPQSDQPGTATEKDLAEIWRKLLGLDTIRRNDDFFALGGHSLLAMQMVAQINMSMDRDIGQAIIFEHPVLSELARHIDARPSEEPRAVLSDSADFGALPPSSAGRFPLSQAQRRFWYSDAFSRGSPAFNSIFLLRLSGTLCADRLEAALRALSAKHATFRTTFEHADGTGEQVIHPDLHPVLERIDLRGLKSRGLDVAKEHFDKSAHLGFDLERGPMLRMIHYACDDGDLIGLVTHHIIVDGVSLEIALSELGAFYEAGKEADTTLPVPSLPFATLNPAPFETAPADDGLAFWQEALANLPRLDLPLDHPRPPVQDVAGNWLPFSLGRDLSNRLRAFAAQEGCTVFSVLHAAISVELGRMSGQKEFGIGAAVANRQAPGTQHIIGSFTNLVVLPTALDSGAGFREIISRSHRTIQSALAHQHVPFEDVVSALGALRDPSRAPLFDVLFVMQPPLQSDRFAQLPFERIEQGLQYSHTDLEFHLWDEADISGRLVYATALFETDTVERLAERLKLLIAHIIERPGLALHEQMPLAERDHLPTQRFTRIGTEPFQTTEFVHDQIICQALQNGSAIAVRCADRELTYADLVAQSESVAGGLALQGIGIEDRVGILLDRSCDAIVAFLACLRIGAAYVPLHKGTPVARLRKIMEQADARLLISNPHSSGEDDSLSTYFPVTSIEKLASHSNQSDTIWHPAQLDPGNLAYVIFTSGSTGVPKGVGITHEALANLVASMQELTNPGPGKVQSSLANFAFDASIAEIYPPPGKWRNACPDTGTRADRCW
jgi:amino acid adenylation domain-containing protein